MIMSGMLGRARAQLGRVTRVQIRYPSPYSVTMFKQCSSTRDPPFSENSMLIRAQFRGVTEWIHPSNFSIYPFKQPSLKDHCSSLGDPLPPSSKNHKKLLEHVVKLTCQSSAGLGHCEVFLVGMLYGSMRSRSNVQAIIKNLKPEAVFLEVSACELKTGELGIEDPDLRVAYKEALKCGGTVVPGDRPMEITEERVWRKMPLFERVHLQPIHFGLDRRWHLRQLVGKFEEELNSSVNFDMEIVTSFNQKLDEISPTFVETYIHERDLYMSAALLEEAKKRRCIVAVVGMSHIPGIKLHWEKPVSVSTLQNLLTVPPIPIYFK